MWVYVAGQLGRVLSYFATGYRTPYFCALAWELEQLGYPQWGLVRRLLDAALGEGHCHQMWLEEMGYADD